MNCIIDFNKAHGSSLSLAECFHGKIHVPLIKYIQVLLAIIFILSKKCVS